MAAPQYDPTSGSLIGYSDNVARADPFSGDSGWSYSDAIKSVLALGATAIGANEAQKAYDFEAKTRYDLGRAGLTPFGVPTGSVQIGSQAVPASELLLLLLAAGLGLYLVAK